MVIQISQLVGGLAIALAGWWARGKTGPISVTEQRTSEAIRDLCSRLEALPNDLTPRQLATLAGEAIAPDMSWPPRPLSAKSHKTAFVLLEEWSREVITKASEQNKTVCEVVIPTTATLKMLLGTMPASPTPGVPPTKVGGLQGGPSNVADVPTAGRWSKASTNPNWGLLQNVGQAYGLPSGAARLYASKVVNNHPFNKAHTPYRGSKEGFEMQNYGPAIIKLTGSTVYFPPASEVEP